MLEAGVGEPVVTEALRHVGPERLDVLAEGGGRWWHPEADLLALARDEELVVRRVVLRGATSSVPYVLAESQVVPGRLPAGIVDALARTGASIGRLLGSRDVESRRDVVDIGLMKAGDAAAALQVEPQAWIAWRTYRIIMQGRAAILITEMLAPGRLSRAAAVRTVRTRPAVRSYATR